MMNFPPYWKVLQILYTKALKNRLSSKKSLHYQKFLIAGRARSGTTLLHTLLNTHPKIASAGEMDPLRVYNELNTSEIKERTIFRHFGPHIKAAGAKILLPVQLQQTTTEVLQNIISVAPEIKIIHLQRKNLLREYVSLKIAEKTDRWSEVKYKNPFALEDKQVEVKPESLLQYFSQAAESHQHYCQLFKKASHFNLNYEELATRPQKTLPLVQEFLQLTPAPVFSLLQKQNPEPLSTLVLNYSTIKRNLQGTPYETFLQPAEN